MTSSPLQDAFRHHVWASLRVFDACLAQPPETLETTVPGTYGSIRDTLRHLVGSDAFYLWCITGDEAHRIDEESMSVEEQRARFSTHDAAWEAVIAAQPDGDEVIHEADPDYGYERDATAGIRFAQALHHGTDHRSQICTALTSVGVEPPAIDVWDFGNLTGRVTEGWQPSDQWDAGTPTPL
jgi:uncharacterized damage-inducible protein DinB